MYKVEIALEGKKGLKGYIFSCSHLSRPLPYSGPTHPHTQLHGVR